MGGAVTPLCRGLPGWSRRDLARLTLEAFGKLIVGNFAENNARFDPKARKSETSFLIECQRGPCTGNLSCAYLDTLCWRSPTQPLPMDWNSRTVFEKLFGDSGSTDRSAREQRLHQHKSILDSVNESLPIGRGT